MTGVPTPTLEYRIWPGESGLGIHGKNDDQRLARVHEVSAWMSRPGRGVRPELNVYARGPMLKRDDSAGPSRGVKVDVDCCQPDWLTQIINDAEDRLGPPGKANTQ